MKNRYQMLQILNALFSMAKAPGVHIDAGLTQDRDGAIRRCMTKGAIFLFPLIGLALPGCVQVAAPDKPIVINLNIAIRQEVLVRLDAASKKVTDENPEIF